VSFIIEETIDNPKPLGQLLHHLPGFGLINLTSKIFRKLRKIFAEGDLHLN